eukprot:COSAG01_NODE_5607_length_4149_cov_9.144198_3_plen_61_part_00
MQCQRVMEMRGILTVHHTGALIGNVEGKACLVGTLAIKDKLAADRIAAEIHDIAAGAMGT